MAPRFRFSIPYAPVVKGHLRAIEPKHRPLIRDTIEQQPGNEPDRGTRNRKPLKRPAEMGAVWEIRCGLRNRFRVFYIVDRVNGVVEVQAIGEKRGNRLYIGEEEVTL